jgi:hypothetical protein
MRFDIVLNDLCALAWTTFESTLLSGAFIVEIESLREKVS